VKPDITTIGRIFTHHPPNADQQNRYVLIRNSAHDFAETLCRHGCKSEELTLALRKLQEAVMWANASIAINEYEPME
jgi:hypothetical protein